MLHLREHVLNQELYAPIQNFESPAFSGTHQTNAIES